MFETTMNVVAIAVVVAIPAVYILLVKIRDDQPATESAADTDAADAPPSLQPVIDPDLCSGCGDCVTACPQSGALSVVDEIAVLTSPENCFAHGACESACPTGAIALRVGTDTRGDTLPVVSPQYESKLPGVYIAGEMAGLNGLHKTVAQAAAAVSEIAASLPKSIAYAHDLVIVGAGPAGLAASLEAQRRGLNYITLERAEVGDAIKMRPAQELGPAAGLELPMYGELSGEELEPETLAAKLSEIARDLGLVVGENEEMRDIEREGEYYRVRSARGSYLTRRVLLAFGRDGWRSGDDAENEEDSVTRSLPPDYPANLLRRLGVRVAVPESAETVEPLALPENVTIVPVKYNIQARPRAARSSSSNPK